MASGVPMVNAPFKTPVRKATPFPQPVALSQSLHTKALLACCLGIAATTMIVMMPPTMTKNNPMCCIIGSKRLPKMQKAQLTQTTQTKATYVCHASIMKSGWKTEYI